MGKTNTKVEDATTQKLYTKADVERMISERLARESKKTKPVDDTDLKGQISDYKKQIALNNVQMAKYEKQLANSRHKIDPAFLDFIEYTVAKTVSSEKSYSDALDEFMAGDGQKYLMKDADVAQVVRQPRPQNNGVPVDADDQRLKSQFGKTSQEILNTKY